jgi:hypothetical protein
MRMLACTLEQLVHSVFVVFALSKHTTDQVNCEHSRRTRTVVALFLQTHGGSKHSAKCSVTLTPDFVVARDSMALAMVAAADLPSNRKST